MIPFRTILVATDLGETSDEVVRAAAALASLTAARLHVVHALDVEVAPYVPLAMVPTFVDPIAVAERLLDEQLGRCVPPALETTRHIEIHSAHRAIADCAARVRADLVVIGPHRRRALGDAVLGGTADRVIRSVTVPCLLVRAPLSLPLRRVFVPFDLSDPGRAALRQAIRWMVAFRPADGAPAVPRLTVAHVVPRYFQSPDFEFDREVIAPELEREGRRAAEHVEGGSDLDIRVQVRWADAAAPAIVEMADAAEADLLVLATRGHGVLHRAFVGGVASAIARTARCPVLLVPVSDEAPAEPDAESGSEGAVPPFGP